jgi:hypothetical protein
MANEATVVPNATRMMRARGSSTMSRPLQIHRAPSCLKPGERLPSLPTGSQIEEIYDPERQAPRRYLLPLS